MTRQTIQRDLLTLWCGAKLLLCGASPHWLSIETWLHICIACECMISVRSTPCLIDHSSRPQGGAVCTSATRTWSSCGESTIQTSFIWNKYSTLVATMVKLLTSNCATMVCVKRRLHRLVNILISSWSAAQIAYSLRIVIEYVRRLINLLINCCVVLARLLETWTGCRLLSWRLVRMLNYHYYYNIFVSNTLIKWENFRMHLFHDTINTTIELTFGTVLIQSSVCYFNPEIATTHQMQLSQTISYKLMN